MSMETSERDRPNSRVNTAAVVIGVVGGVIMGAAALYAGSPWVAIGFVAITWGFSAFLLFGARVSDTIALIADDVHDERHVHLHQKAALYTLNLVAVVIVGAFVVDVARGGTG